MKDHPSRGRQGVPFAFENTPLLRLRFPSSALAARAAMGLGVATLTVLTVSAAEIYSMAWRPDGSAVALGGYKEVRLIDPATRKALATLPGEAEAVRSIAFSRDGSRLAAAGGLPARKGEVKIWDVATQKELATISGHSDAIYAV